MRIITHRCPECGTIVAANVIEEHRVMKCPRSRCQEVLRFEDLSKEQRSFLLGNRETYQM